MKKNCKTCNKEFETNDARRKYCCELCAAKALRERQRKNAQQYQKRLGNLFKKSI